MRHVAVFVCVILTILAANGKRYRRPEVNGVEGSEHGAMHRRSNHHHHRHRHVLHDHRGSDLKAASTNHHPRYGSSGRVVIKVYRGPDDGTHAPHGYWVRQPSGDNYK